MFITQLKKILMAIVRKVVLIAIFLFGCYVIVTALIDSDKPTHKNLINNFETKLQAIKEKKQIN